MGKSSWFCLWTRTYRKRALKKLRPKYSDPDQTKWRLQTCGSYIPHLRRPRADILVSCFSLGIGLGVSGTTHGSDLTGFCSGSEISGGISRTMSGAFGSVGEGVGEGRAACWVSGFVREHACNKRRVNIKIRIAYFFISDDSHKIAKPFESTAICTSDRYERILFGCAHRIIRCVHVLCVHSSFSADLLEISSCLILVENSQDDFCSHCTISP